jgi:alpha-tubulin suppressor-like RCC1 family protein
MFSRKLLCGILLLFGSGGTVFGAVLDTGFSHTCAIINGGVKCWGDNEYGQLGDGTTTNRHIPVDVSGLSSGVISIAVGLSYSCALISDGGVKCWGWNLSGQLGDGTTTDRHIPVDVNGLTNGVISIAMGISHSSCALTSGGGVKCWGNNAYGQLGDGTSEFSENVPVDISGLASDVISIAVGSYHSCVLTSGGRVKCWGSNAYGQLGDSDTGVIKRMPVDIIGLTSGVTAIAAGSNFSCAILNDRIVKCWGGNILGQLGNGTTSYTEHTLVDVTGLNSDVTAIALGGFHSCVLTNSNGVKCWGNNLYGQLGDNTTTDRLTPVDVSGLTNGVTAIAMRSFHSCALTNTGTIKCWGNNDDGQLGDGTIERRLTPVNVKFGDDTTIVLPTPVDVDFDSDSTSSTDSTEPTSAEKTYEAGLNDVITQCQNDPASCGIVASCSPVDTHASFSPSDGTLTIPAVDVPDASGDITVYQAEMSLVPGEGLVFSVTNAEPIQ